MGRPFADLDVFHVIADPTRRALLDQLAEGEKPVGDLRPPHRMSAPALSQHLRVLLDAGLVSQKRRGRQRVYRLNPRPLRRVGEWVVHYERFWRGRLADLRQHLEEHP